MNKFRGGSNSELSIRQLLKGYPATISEPIISPSREQDVRTPKGRFEETTERKRTNTKKTHKVRMFLETINELSVYIGILKSKNFSVLMINGSEMPERVAQNTSERVTPSSKLSFFAKLTKIQESLCDITTSIISTRTMVKDKFQSKELLKQLDEDIKELDVDLEKYRGYILTGSSLNEAEIQYARVITEKCLRHLDGCSSEVPTEEIYTYLVKISDFFLALSIRILYIEAKQTPLRY